MNKTYMQKQGEINRNWHLVDASDKVLGRLATEIAQKLIGKHKPTYTPHLDGGDFVVVINATQIKVTGNKEADKIYYRHSNFPGGLKSETYAELFAKHPERIIEKAVYNMLPKNRLRQHRIKRLKVYTGSEHNHQSQLAVKE